MSVFFLLSRAAVSASKSCCPVAAYYFCALALLWPLYGIGQAIIFSSCGFFYLPLLLFSLPNLGRPRLDVYRTFTYDVALVRILDAGLKCAARGSLKIQDAKNRHLCTIAQLCRAVSSQLRHVSTIGKETC